MDLTPEQRRKIETAINARIDYWQKSAQPNAEAVYITFCEIREILKEVFAE